MQNSNNAVHFDEPQYLEQISLLEENAGQFQSVIDRVNALNLGITFEPGDLLPLYSNPKDFFTKKLVTEPMTINGLNLDSSKVFELLDTPPELKTIIAEVEKSNPAHLQTFEIKDNGVNVKPEILENLKVQYSVFLENETQKTVYENLSQIVECLNNIQQTNSNFRPIFLFERYLQTNAESTICEINFAELKRVY